MHKQPKFYLAPKGHGDGEHPIRIAASVHGTRLITTIGESVRPEFWNDATKTVSFPSKVTNAHGLTDKQLNALMLKIVAEFASYEAGLAKTYKPSIEELRDKLAAITGTTRKTIPSKREKAEARAKALEEEQTRKEAEKAAKTVSDYFDEFVAEEKVSKEWSESTLAKMKTFSKDIADFDKLEYINSEEGIRQFVGMLRDEDLANRTAQKKYAQLRWFLRWCERKGYIDTACKYQPTFKVIARPVIYLRPEELMKLYRYEVPANGTKVKLHNAEGKEYEKTVEDAGALSKTRDLFCFCAFTSLRYSDMAKLRRSDITDEGLRVVTQKTHDRLTIELNKYSRAILGKYKDLQHPQGLALPVITNQKMNEYLKDLCELCEINEPIRMDSYKAGKKVSEVLPKYQLIGTHAARRTFICNALSLGIPPQTVMKWTGHADYQAMRPYIDITGKAKAEAMAKFDNMEAGL